MVWIQTRRTILDTASSFLSQVTRHDRPPLKWTISAHTFLLGDLL